MNYTPTDWQTGNIITSEKLNNIENGIANNDIFIIKGTLIENTQNNQHQLNKTFQEIEQVAESKLIVLAIERRSTNNFNYQVTDSYFLSYISKEEETNIHSYNLVFSGDIDSSIIVFSCNNIEDYPIEEIVE